jgi:membrane protease YdiL (CAAX protease family)
MSDSTKRQIFTSVALLVLLVFRLPLTDLLSSVVRVLGAHSAPAWLVGFGLVEDWTYSFWYRWSLPLAGLVLIANRSDLQSLNVDLYFVTIFILSGLVSFRFSALEPWGWASAIISIAIFLLYRKGAFKFGPAAPRVGLTKSLLGIVSIVSVLVLVFSFMWGLLTNRAMGSTLHTFLTDLPLLVVEELIFRGMLWMFLDRLGWAVPKIIIFQAILFWLAHSYYISTFPFHFWVVIPIGSVLFGVLVWKTKSITSSTLAHLALNGFLALLWAPG